MRVHFGGSVKKFKMYPEAYKAISDAIKSLGHEIVRDWVDEEIKGVTVPMSLQYEFTASAIKNADAVILENSFSSTAVGQQLMLALQCNLPVLMLQNPTLIKQSKKADEVFISKNLEKLVLRKKYNHKNVKSVIESFLNVKSNKTKTARFNLVIDKVLDRYLKNLATKNRSNKSSEIRKLVVEKMLSESL